jgi:hypothetical protein
VDLRVGRLAVVLPKVRVELYSEAVPGGPCLVVEMVSGAGGEYGPAEEDGPKADGKADAEEPDTDKIAEAEGPVADGATVADEATVADGATVADETVEDEPEGPDGAAEGLAETPTEMPTEIPMEGP